MVIWGNHSLTQYPDFHHGSVSRGNGTSTSIIDAVNDLAYLQGPFQTKVQKRGGEIISVMKKSSAASAANAACDHMHDWWVGTKEGEFASMGVISDHEKYGVKPGTCFSYPVICKGGEWQVVDGLPINEFGQEKLNKTEKELLDERKMALNF